MREEGRLWVTPGPEGGWVEAGFMVEESVCGGRTVCDYPVRDRTYHEANNERKALEVALSHDEPDATRHYIRV